MHPSSNYTHPPQARRRRQEELPRHRNSHPRVCPACRRAQVVMVGSSSNNNSSNSNNSPTTTQASRRAHPNSITSAARARPSSGAGTAPSAGVARTARGRGPACRLSWVCPYRNYSLFPRISPRVVGSALRPWWCSKQGRRGTARALDLWSRI